MSKDNKDALVFAAALAVALTVWIRGVLLPLAGMPPESDKTALHGLAKSIACGAPDARSKPDYQEICLKP